jgi:L-aspartate oxidase
MTGAGEGGGNRVVIVGGGIAGLVAALTLAPRPVTVVVSGRIGSDAATAWAQGGIAAALGGDDSPALHAADTLAVGAGLGDAAVAEKVAADGARCIEALTGWGVRFDRVADGSLALGLEAAHSRRRIAHSGGDRTGEEILAALVHSIRAIPAIMVVEDCRIENLVLTDGALAGVTGKQNGRPWFLPARAVVLATGGIGGLYAATTNPLGATGSGLVLAARAGAVLRDVEFVQFHPTAMVLDGDPMPLASEAIRGEGAVLIDERGERFMAELPGAELAPRDVVARAIRRHLDSGHAVFLDGRQAIGARFPSRFPAVTVRCRAAGLDPVRQPIPVRPAAHYHMGGVKVDARGRTNVAGLWACGEVAATGLHGANRLASNSLLEAVAGARWAAEDIAGWMARPRPPFFKVPQDTVGRDTPLQAAAIRQTMDALVGVVREQAGLEEAVDRLGRIAFGGDADRRSADLALAGLFVAVGALWRQETRGAHFRADHPLPLAEARHADLTLANVQTLAVTHATAGEAAWRQACHS